jgi:hypothetical protein
MPLIEAMDEAIEQTGRTPFRLVSGAGHDAMVMAALCPTAMLFIRCAGGISHNPAESVTNEDCEVALQVMLRFIDKLGEQVEDAKDHSDWSDQAFIQRFGALFDHSPWIIERAAKLGPVDDLHATLMKIVEDAAPDEQIALICAHPELAGKAAIDHELTEASAAEQASPGSIDCQPASLSIFMPSTQPTAKNLVSRSSSASASPTRQASLQQCIAASTTRGIRRCEMRSARSVRSFACAWEKLHDA